MSSNKESEVTLHDHYAAAALAGLLKDYGMQNDQRVIERICYQAHRIAEAMIKVKDFKSES